MHQTNELYTRLAAEGRGVDYDGMFGTQCTDIAFDLTGNYCGQPINGNAIGLLDSARAAGYTVLSGLEEPRPGDLYVMDTTILYGHPYGHTGYIWQVNSDGTFETVEQNVGDGANLYSGTVAQFVHRDRSYIIGYIRPDYQQ